MAHINKEGKVVATRARKIATKKKKFQSIEGKSFYFLGPRKWNFPLYIGYIIKDMGETIRVWIMRKDTREEKECTIRTDIITYETKNDNKEEREMYNSANILRAKIQDKEKQELKSQLKHV